MFFCFPETALSSRRYHFFIFLLLGLLLFCIRGYAQEREEEVEVVADDLQYFKAERKLVGVGNVVVVYGGVELTADRTEVQVDTKQVHAEGHVLIRQRGKGTLSGDEVFFDFKNSQGSFPNGRFFQFPWYGYGEQLQQVNKGKIKAKNVYITSCDLPHPHYDVKAKDAVFYPGDKIVAKNVVLRILEVPVFWWPYLVIPLDYTPVDLTPGYSDEYGGFVLFAKGFSISQNVKGRLLFDWYSKRGFGFGAELEYKFERLGVGEVKIFGIRDKKSPDQRAANPFENKNRREQNRGRVSWKHKARLDPYTTLQLQWHELSDDRFLQDFFEREYRQEIDPQSFLTITRNADQYSLLTHVEKRTNRFQTVAEKLPEVVFTWLRRPLFDTNFYYTNEEGFVNFNQTKAFSSDGPDTVQFYTDQELSYPLRFFRFYNFIPFVDFREDYFTKSRSKESGLSRYVLGTGFDASTRFYQTWDYKGRFLGIELNQIRHVLEPIVQYNAIKLASVNPSRIVGTGRGDRLDLQDILTFGVENRIQTKRKARNQVQRIDLVSFNAFLDYSFGPGSELLRTRENRFTEARVETILRPYDWLVFRMDTVFDLVDYRFSSNNLDFALDPGRLHLMLSHRYARNRGSVDIDRVDARDTDADSQLTVDALYQLNDRWDVGAYIRWKMLGNILEEWEIRASRDLHDWLLDFGYNVRNSDRTNASKELNKEFFLRLRLKALPSIALKTGHRASFSGPRIGKSISGANEAPLPPSFVVAPDAQYASLSTS